MIHLKPLLLRFIPTNALVSIAAGGGVLLVESLFDIEIPSSGTVVPACMVTAFIVCNPFIKIHKRVFSKQERFYMTWTSTLLSILVSLVLFTLSLAGVMLFYDLTLSQSLVALGLSNLSGSVIIGVSIFTLLVAWIVWYWIYGFVPKTLLKELNKIKT
jgi:hypothetical protein